MNLIICMFDVTLSIDVSLGNCLQFKNSVEERGTKAYNFKSFEPQQAIKLFSEYFIIHTKYIIIAQLYLELVKNFHK